MLFRSMSFTPDVLDYYEDSAEELAVINYTSGTSGFSKGVMIPYRAIFSNMEFARKVLPQLNNTSNVVSVLPCAHMYGLMFEVLYELSVGCHVHFLSRVPSPKIIMQALAEVKPKVVIAVPLVIDNTDAIIVTAAKKGFVIGQYFFVAFGQVGINGFSAGRAEVDEAFLVAFTNDP